MSRIEPRAINDIEKTINDVDKYFEIVDGRTNEHYRFAPRPPRMDQNEYAAICIASVNEINEQKAELEGEIQRVGGIEIAIEQLRTLPTANPDPLPEPEPAPLPPPID